MSILNFIIFGLILSLSAHAMGPDVKKLWDKREVKENLESALSKLEQEHIAQPADVEILGNLAKGYFLMGEFHTDDIEQKKKYYQTGMKFGEAGMELNPGYKEFKKKDKIEKAIEDLSLNEIQPLFWTATSLGKYAKAEGIMKSLKYKDQIKQMISKVGELKPDFHFGAVPRYWATFFAVAPGIAGGDMDESKKQFRKAMEMAPEYLGTWRLRAENYWVKVGDEKEFEKDLRHVLESKGDDHPEIGPENKMEKKVAQKLLDQKNKLF